MTKLHHRQLRVNRYVSRRAKRLRWSLARHVRDPRGRRGRRLQFEEGFLGALLAGMLAGCWSLRDVEELTEQLGIRDKDGRSVDKISDTALGDVAAGEHPDDFAQVLVEQVRDMARLKELRPVGLLCGVLVVDGKAQGKLLHDAQGHALGQTDSNGSQFFYGNRSAGGRTRGSRRARAGQGAVVARGGSGSPRCVTTTDSLPVACREQLAQGRGIHR